MHVDVAASRVAGVAELSGRRNGGAHAVQAATCAGTSGKNAPAGSRGRGRGSFVGVRDPIEEAAFAAGMVVLEVDEVAFAPDMVVVEVTAWPPRGERDRGGSIRLVCGHEARGERYHRGRLRRPRVRTRLGPC